MTTVVLGPTGNIGSHLVGELVARGVKVRAAGRKRGAAVPGVEWVGFDFQDKATYGKAFEGAERLFLLTPVDPKTVEMTRDVIEAAKRAGIQRVVKLSAIGAGAPSRMTFARWHTEAEKVVEASGLEFTHLRPNGFMQNYSTSYVLPIKTQGGFHVPQAEGRVSYIDTRDVAAAAAVVLSESGHAGCKYTLTGPQALSCAETAAALSQEIGKPVRYMPITDEQARKGMLSFGMPEWLVTSLIELYATYREGLAKEVTDDVRRLTGRPARSFAAFVHDHRAVWL